MNQEQETEVNLSSGGHFVLLCIFLIAVCSVFFFLCFHEMLDFVAAVIVIVSVLSKLSAPLKSCAAGFACKNANFLLPVHPRIHGGDLRLRGDMASLAPSTQPKQEVQLVIKNMFICQLQTGWREEGGDTALLDHLQAIRLFQRTHFQAQEVKTAVFSALPHQLGEESPVFSI